MMLRPYQVAAVNAVFDAFDRYRSTLVVKPTGTGKTVVIAECARRFRPKGRALVLAHREELIVQAAEKIRQATDLSVAIEMASQRVAPLFMPDVTVASIQTLSRPTRLNAFAPDSFGLVIVDEAHHSTSASYRTILDYFAQAKILGVTATPDRSDRAGLGAVFESVAFVYDIRTAIREGYLVPIRQKMVDVAGLDLSSVRTTAGDFDQGDLEKAFLQERHLHSIASPLAELVGDRPTIVFATSVAHAHALAEVLGPYVGGADNVRSLDGASDPDVRRRAVVDFGAGKFQFLVNCLLFTEGFDAPRISCVANSRPTKSRSLYAQIVGRGTRLCEGKRDLLVLNFVGQAGHHSLVNTADILGSDVDESVRQRALNLLARRPDLDVLSAIEAAATPEEDTEMASVSAEQRRQLVAKAHYTSVEVNPFESIERTLGIKVGAAGGAPATDAQRFALSRKGIELSKIDQKQADQILGTLSDRYERGLCTFKQAQILARFGLEPNMTFRDAVRAINRIAKNGWKSPTAAQPEGTP